MAELVYNGPVSKKVGIQCSEWTCRGRLKDMSHLTQLEREKWTYLSLVVMSVPSSSLRKLGPECHFQLGMKTIFQDPLRIQVGPY